jgi:glucokinase
MKGALRLVSADEALPFRDSVPPALSVGIDIGGTKIAAGLIDARGRVHHTATAGTPRPALAESILEAVGRLVAGELAVAHRLDRQVVGVGVGTAGVVDPVTGTITSATETLVDWKGVEVSTRLASAVGLGVRVDNDVNAMAVAESQVGVGRGHGRILLIAVGTGIGGALVHCGGVDRGVSGTAGEVGHLPVGPTNGPRCPCGRRGHLEAYAAGPAIARRYAELASTKTGDFRNVADRAATGDGDAVEALQEGATILGRALGGLVNVLDPEVVILAGGVVRAGPPFTGPLRDAFKAELLPGTSGVRLRHARFRSRAAVVGAGLLAFEGTLSPRERGLAAPVHCPS